MATIYSAAGSMPVKVRDLSSNGALIEGADIQTPEAFVRLCRGRLEVAAQVAWSSAGRAGLKFTSAISVNDWLPRALSKDPQQLTDETVQRARVMCNAKSILHRNLESQRFDSMSASDLTDLRLSLESLAEDLAADPQIVERHLSKLQTLDLVSQALKSVAKERRT